MNVNLVNVKLVFLFLHFTHEQLKSLLVFYVFLLIFFSLLLTHEIIDDIITKLIEEGE